MRKNDLEVNSFVARQAWYIQYLTHSGQTKTVDHGMTILIKLPRHFRILDQEKVPGKT